MLKSTEIKTALMRFKDWFLRTNNNREKSKIKNKSKKTPAPKNRLEWKKNWKTMSYYEFVHQHQYVGDQYYEFCIAHWMWHKCVFCLLFWIQYRSHPVCVTCSRWIYICVANCGLMEIHCLEANTICTCAWIYKRHKTKMSKLQNKRNENKREFRTCVE